MASSPKGLDKPDLGINTDVTTMLPVLRCPTRNNIIAEHELVRPLPVFRRKRAESYSLPSSQDIEKKQMQKMKFILNALDQGWTIKKKDSNYIFTKKHENKREVFRDNYLENFLISNFAADTEK